MRRRGPLRWSACPPRGGSTTPASAGALTVGCDGGVQVPPHTIVANGGFPALLLTWDTVTITGAGRLRARVARPLILAVKGDAKHPR